MKNQQHRIQKLTLNIRGPARKQAENLEKELMQHQIKLVQILSTVFDEATPEGQTLRLNRVEIDLGRVPPNRFYEKLKEALKQQFPAITETEAKTRKQHPQQNDEKDPAAPTAPDKRPTEMLLHYLAHGTLPWWSAKDEPLPDANFLVNLPQTQKPPLRKSVLEILAKTPAADQRIIYAYAKALPQILHFLMPEYTIQQHSALLQVASQTIKQGSTIIPPPSPSTVFAQLFIRQLTRAGKEVSIEPGRNITLPARALATFLKQYNLTETLLPLDRNPGIKTTQSDLSPKNSGWLKKIINLTIHLSDKLTDTGEFATQPVDTAKQSPEEPAKSLSPKKAGERSTRKKNLPEAVTTAHYIQNAGLVLLHPFLESCFKTLNYLNDKKQLKNPETAVRAVNLMHYLTNGNMPFREYNCALNKVLCGISPASPVWETELFQNEIHEAGEVLQSVIEHWKKLKGTSVEGLRETFLLREGKLAGMDGRYHLYLAPSAFDVLLSYLPWSYTVIKLPWMKTVLTASGKK